MATYPMNYSNGAWWPTQPTNVQRPAAYPSYNQVAPRPVGPTMQQARSVVQKRGQATTNAAAPVIKRGQTPIAQQTPTMPPPVAQPTMPTGPSLSPEQVARQQWEQRQMSTARNTAPGPVAPPSAPAPTMQKSVASPSNTTLTGQQRQSAYERAMSRTT